MGTQENRQDAEPLTVRRDSGRSKMERDDEPKETGLPESPAGPRFGDRLRAYLGAEEPLQRHEWKDDAGVLRAAVRDAELPRTRSCLARFLSDAHGWLPEGEPEAARGILRLASRTAIAKHQPLLELADAIDADAAEFVGRSPRILGPGTAPGQRVPLACWRCHSAWELPAGASWYCPCGAHNDPGTGNVRTLRARIEEALERLKCSAGVYYGPARQGAPAPAIVEIEQLRATLAEIFGERPAEPEEVEPLEFDDCGQAARQTREALADSWAEGDESGEVRGVDR